MQIKVLLKWARDLTPSADCWKLADDDFVPKRKSRNKKSVPNWCMPYGTHSAKNDWAEVGVLKLIINKASFMEWKDFAACAKWKDETLTFYYAMRGHLQRRITLLAAQFGAEWVASHKGMRALSEFITVHTSSRL